MTFNKSHPFIAKIQERHLLTKPGSTKQTYHISLDLSGSNIQFKPGDSIAIFAQNHPSLVEHMIEAMQATGKEKILDRRSSEEINLLDFLSKKANLARISSSFLKLFHAYETSHDKKNQLSRLLDPENKPLLLHYLKERDPLDLFKEYKTAQLPLQELCDQFGSLLPRFYSVASSQRVHPNRVDLLVALFTFTHSGEKRFGVASHFLCQLAQENLTSIPLYLQSSKDFALPDDPTAPLIMIGPGTGVAPFRAFLQERIQTGAPGRNWLLFGERNRNTDYLYEDFFEPLAQQGILERDLAFSRDQFEKIYVQDRLYAKAKQLWEWMQEGAYLYVCGDAQHMAKDVEAILQRIAIEQGYLSEEAAKQFWKSMRIQKRYLQDVY